MKQPLCYHGHPYPRTAEWDEAEEALDEMDAADYYDDGPDEDEEISDDDPTELW
jgi:hypothetical protein